jgi:hypothetical protein
MEAGLSLGYPDFCAEVGFFLGYGRKLTTDYTAVQLATIDANVQSGIRRVYYPPAVEAQTLGYEWSWLRPTTTMNIYGAAAIAGSDGAVNGTALTATSVSDWVAKGVTSGMVVNITNLSGTVVNGTYEISNVSGNTVTLAESIGVGNCNYYFSMSADYDLPDDFGRLIGTLHFPPATYYASIVLVSVGKLMQMRTWSDFTGAPTHAAIRYKPRLTTPEKQTGQRQEIMFFPTPDQNYELSYEYEAYNGPLTTTYAYPLGGMYLSELYLESCLAIAESRINDAPGQHTEQFKALLIDAINRDMKHGARYFGAMGHKENIDLEFRRGYTGTVYPITYHNQVI